MIRTILLLAAMALPPIKPLFDFPLGDTCVCLAPDKTYYLIGNDPQAPFRERPSILPIHINAAGKIEADQ